MPFCETFGTKTVFVKSGVCAVPIKFETASKTRRSCAFLARATSVQDLVAKSKMGRMIGLATKRLHS
eukprot:1898779-Amphidinium_carterae.1